MFLVVFLSFIKYWFLIRYKEIQPKYNRNTTQKQSNRQDKTRQDKKKQ